MAGNKPTNNDGDGNANINASNGNGDGSQPLALNHSTNLSSYTPSDIYFMEYVLKMAQGAYDNGEVPIGAVVVVGDTIIGKGYNLKETRQDTVAHAEILAIQDASKAVGTWRLSNSTLYTNVEPCIMCCGAILHARVDRVVFCASEPKFGGVISQANLFDIPTLNHRVRYQYGLMAAESQNLIRQFFREIRAEAQHRKSLKK